MPDTGGKSHSLWLLKPNLQLVKKTANPALTNLKVTWSDKLIVKCTNLMDIE